MVTITDNLLLGTLKDVVVVFWTHVVCLRAGGGG
jgi:hypothetical protein